MELNVVLGLDVLPSRGKTFSAYLISLKKEVAYKELSLREVLKLCWKEHVDAIAVDNVYEIAESEAELAKFASLLPLRTKIVQVTGPFEGVQYPLGYLAKKHDLIDAYRHLSPLEAARVSAKLAKIGVGCLVEVFQPRTVIRISRGRVPGSGGWSSDRFQRRINNAIKQRCDEIEERLKKLGIDYDLFKRETKHGYLSAYFIVYTPRENLYGVVKPSRGPDVKVLVRPVPRPSLKFVPMGAPPEGGGPTKKYLIVGIDPGTVTGVAILDLKGNVLHVSSHKHLDRGQLTELIMRYGKTVIVATDVKPAPSYAQKLSSTLNAVLYEPEQSLRVDEKQEIINQLWEKGALPQKVSDAHQRDALAAAVKAFYHYKNKLEQAEAHARSMGVMEGLDEIKAYVIKGYAIRDAINTVIGRTVPKEAPKPPRAAVDKELEERIRELEQKIASLVEALRRKDETIAALQGKLESLEQKLREAERKLEKAQKMVDLEARKDKIVQLAEKKASLAESKLKKAEEELSAKEREVRELKQVLEELAEGKLVSLKALDSVTPSSVSELLKSIEKGDVLFVRDSNAFIRSAGELLVKKGVRALVASSVKGKPIREFFESKGVPVVEVSSVPLKVLEDVVVAERDPLESAIKAREEKVEEKSKKATLEMLEEIINQYRRSRWRIRG